MQLSEELAGRLERAGQEHLCNFFAGLDEAEQAEYKAIIERAMKAREDAKAKPMTEMEKAQARLAKAKEALAKLEAQAAQGNV